MPQLRANAFEIGFPTGWSDHSTVVMIGPERPAFSPNLQVNQEPIPSDVSIADYLVEQRTELSNLENFQLLGHGDRILAGQRADWHAYSWRIPQGVEIRQLQLMTVRGDKVYTLTASSTLADWEYFEPAFEMSMAQFKFV